MPLRPSYNISMFLREKIEVVGSIRIVATHSKKQKTPQSKPVYETVVVGDEIVNGEV